MSTLLKRFSFKRNLFKIISALLIVLLIIAPVYSEEYHNIVYDGVVTPANIATAGLYIYTPWIGQGGGGAYEVGGNYLFWNLWYNYFDFGRSTIVPPTVTTLPADNITTTSARLHGSINDTGGEDPFDAGFGYRLKSGGPETVIKYGVGNYYADLTGLAPGTTYEFRFWAENSAGRTYGSYLSFTTLPTTPIISLSGDLNFGNVQVGTTSTKTLTISNTGNSTLTVTSISYPTGFSGSWNGTISAGGSYNVTVTFSPTQAITYSGNLTVNSDATSGTNTKSVSGTGTQIPTPIISLSGDLNFGNVQVGTTSPKTLTISNTGNSTLTVTSISYPTGFSGSWSGTISAGGSYNVTVTFSPTQAITYSGNLTVNSNATSGTNTKSVSGTGVQSTLLGDFGSANNGPPDCKVDFEDLMIFAMAYGSTSGDDNWNLICDIAGPGGSLTPDGVIDFEDLMIFAMQYGKTCADQ